MIEVVRTVEACKIRCRELGREGLSLGFVPTMGALHRGHLSLIERARKENDRVVVSIFVNPTQYDDPKDLEDYPRTLEADLAAAEAAGADFAFCPDNDEIYFDEYRFRVTETRDSRELEGAHREGHFDGVLTVVLKLFEIVRPDRAYFGEKDWQQYELVRDMAAALFLGVEVLPCPVVREADGLAMSSRNVHLSADQRRLAPTFHRVLASGRPVDQMRGELEAAGLEVDYVERRGGRIVGAVRLGKVRLIDNVEA
ncbi:MAG: pantoate--beta-alanine ligase [Holophagae bacterium]